MAKHRCQAQRRDGQPCTSAVVGLDGYCFVHSPDQVAVRAAQTRGGQHKASIVRLRNLCPPRLVPVFNDLVQAMADVRAGTLKPAEALALASLARAAVAVLQAGEVESRLRDLEGQTRGA
jgi:hypothetical protein